MLLWATRVWKVHPEHRLRCVQASYLPGKIGVRFYCMSLKSQSNIAGVWPVLAAG